MVKDDHVILSHQCLDSTDNHDQSVRYLGTQGLLHVLS